MATRALKFLSDADRRAAEGEVRQRHGGGAEDVALGIEAPSRPAQPNFQAAYRFRPRVLGPVARLL